MIYLDNGATTFPKPEVVYTVMDKTNRELAINAGRGSYKTARQVSEIIVETKQLLRKLIHADANTAVVFAPSITIALNQVINGFDYHDGECIYLSPFEHNAVARTIHKISKEKNLKVKILPLDTNSLEIDIDMMRYDFSKDKPAYVFCTHISNVTGYILPVKEIFEESKKYGSINVLDTAQSLGLIDLNTNAINVDIVAFAGHKTLYGPLGIGGFMNISGVKLKEFITGGTGSDSLNLEMPNGRETKYESASSNIIAIAGLNAALKNLNQEKLFRTEKKLTEYLISELESVDKIHLYLPRNRNNHIAIVSFTFSDMNSEDIGFILDEDYDIAVRTGYHCAPLIHDYLDDKKSMGTVRVGIGQFTTKNDIDSLTNALKEI